MSATNNYMDLPIACQHLKTEGDTALSLDAGLRFCAWAGGNGWGWCKGIPA